MRHTMNTLGVWLTGRKVDISPGSYRRRSELLGGKRRQQREGHARSQLADSKLVVLSGKQVVAKAGRPCSMPRMLLACRMSSPRALQALGHHISDAADPKGFSSYLDRGWRTALRVWRA